MQIFLPLTNLFHPAFEMISLEENNEDALIDLVTSAWVFKWGLNLHLLKEHITTTGTPQKSLKWMHSFTSNHSCHKSMRGIYYIEKTVIKEKFTQQIGTFFFSAAKNLFNDRSLAKMSKWSCTKKCMAKKHKQKERDNKQKQQAGIQIFLSTSCQTLRWALWRHPYIAWLLSYSKMTALFFDFHAHFRQGFHGVYKCFESWNWRVTDHYTIMA